MPMTRARPAHLASPYPAPPRRTEEPAPRPVVRGRHRQWLQRRDPVDGRPGTFRKRSTLAPEEVDRLYDATRSTPAWAIDELRRRAARLRGRGAGLPACAPKGRPGVSSLWDHHQAIAPGGFRDQLLPRLPTLTVRALLTVRSPEDRFVPLVSRPRAAHAPASLGEAQDLAGPEVARVADVVEALEGGDGGAEARGDADLSVSPDLTL